MGGSIASCRRTRTDNTRRRRRASGWWNGEPPQHSVDRRPDRRETSSRFSGTPDVDLRPLPDDRNGAADSEPADRLDACGVPAHPSDALTGEQAALPPEILRGQTRPRSAPGSSISQLARPAASLPLSSRARRMRARAASSRKVSAAIEARPGATECRARYDGFLSANRSGGIRRAQTQHRPGRIDAGRKRESRVCSWSPVRSRSWTGVDAGFVQGLPALDPTVTVCGRGGPPVQPRPFPNHPTTTTRMADDADHECKPGHRPNDSILRASRHRRHRAAALPGRHGAGAIPGNEPRVSGRDPSPGGRSTRVTGS